MESFDSIRDTHVKTLIEELQNTAEELIKAGMVPEDVEHLIAESLKEPSNAKDG